MTTPTTKTIEITVSPEGAVSIKTAGFTGSQSGSSASSMSSKT
jgi:hypothetical protein